MDVVGSYAMEEYRGKSMNRIAIGQQPEEIMDNGKARRHYVDNHA